MIGFGWKIEETSESLEAKVLHWKVHAIIASVLRCLHWRDREKSDLAANHVKGLLDKGKL